MPAERTFVVSQQMDVSGGGHRILHLYDEAGLDSCLGLKVAPSYYQGAHETDPDPHIEQLAEQFRGAHHNGGMPYNHGIMQIERASGVRVLFYTDCDGHTSVWTGRDWTAI